MTAQPNVSVIIPTYNRAPLLGRAIRSVLDQTYRDFQLIIVDDGSTDDTPAAVAAFDDPRILYLRQPANLGGAAARNVAIAAATTPFIAFQDSDDQWRPDKLQKQLDLFATLDNSVGVVYTAFWHIAGQRKTYIPGPHVKHRHGNLHAQLLKGNFITPQTTVVRRQCFQTTGTFDPDLRSRHDWDLWLRLARDWLFAFIDEPLVTVYQTPDSISLTQDVTRTGWLPIVRKHHADFRKRPWILGRHYLTIGVNAEILQPQAFAFRRKYLLKGILTWPLVSPKYHALALLSLLGRRIFTKIVAPFVKKKP